MPNLLVKQCCKKSTFSLLKSAKWGNPGEECGVLGGAGSVPRSVVAALLSPRAVRAVFEFAFGRVGFA